jgi:hypothetical protein
LSENVGEWHPLGVKKGSIHFTFTSVRARPDEKMKGRRGDPPIVPEDLPVPMKPYDTLTSPQKQTQKHSAAKKRRQRDRPEDESEPDSPD